MKKFIQRFLCMTLIAILCFGILSCGSEGSDSSQSSVKDSQSSTSDSQSKKPNDSTDDNKAPVDDFDSMSDKEKAFYILEKDVADQNHKTEMSLLLSAIYMGYELEAEASSTAFTVYADGEYEEYEETKISMTMAGKSSVQKAVEGYVDGKKIYKSVNSGITVSAKYEEMSFEDYLAQKEDDSSISSFNITEENCKSVSFKKDKAGNYVVTFASLTKDGLLPFEELVSGAFSSLISNELKDVSFTVTTTPEFFPISMSADFIFEGENAPSLTLTVECTYDDSFTIPDIDWSEYKKAITVNNFESATPEEQAFFILTSESDQNAMRVDTAISFEGDYIGNKVTMTITQTSYVIYEEDTYSEYSEIQISAYYKGKSSEAVMKQGYLNGRAFAHVTYNGVLYSAEAKTMTVNEYFELKAEGMGDGNEYFGITEQTAQSVTCTKENGLYYAVFSQLSGKALEYFKEIATEYFSDFLANEVRDVTLTVTADETFEITELSAVYSFFGANPPKATIVSTYTYGDTVEIPEMDWSDFKQISGTIAPPSSVI